jgi:hypothetical protein
MWFIKNGWQSLMISLGLFAASVPVVGQTNMPVDAGLSGEDGFYELSQFGPVATPAQAEATFTLAASNIVAAGGGVIVLPTNTATGWVPRNNNQTVWRDPHPPLPAKRWGVGSGVTVLDSRGKNLKITTPQVGGLEINRTLNLSGGDSLPFWDYFPMLSLKNTILHGSTSYREWLLEDVPAGKDRRFYVKTIRGVFPGMFMSIGEYGVVQRLYVKSLGYDKDKKLWYFVADVEADMSKGTIMGNKNHVNVMRMQTFSHNENQTFDVMLERHNYSQGDNYMYSARVKYMGDNHSSAGDENSVLYAAFINANTDIFRGKVEQWTPGNAELKIRPGSITDTLGSGRPIINMNPAKWLTNGTVTVGSGTIRFSEEAGINDEVIGRYFAVDEPGEYVPKGKAIRRWYLISKVERHLNGTTDIKIIRQWWGANDSGAPKLYKLENQSQDGRVKPLRYVIAPGANAYDVSGAVKNSKPVIKLVPTPFAGTPADFAAGDDVEQAIGADPFHPISFRSWLWDAVPSQFPSPIFDIANYGDVMRHSVLSVRGGSMKFKDDLSTRYDHNPPWGTIISLESVCHNGIRFMADVGSSAILFSQPNNREQPIKWMYKTEGDGREKFATLTVATTNGDFNFRGGNLRVAGAVMAKGLSAGPLPARNLRGKNVAVEGGATSFSVQFPVKEEDDDYAVFIEQTWMGNRMISAKQAGGFTVEFEKPAPRGAKIDWLIVR